MKKTIKKITQKYKAPTPKFWRILGDTLLIIAASVTAYQFNNEAWQDYRTALIVVFLIAGKFLTNFNSK